MTPILISKIFMLFAVILKRLAPAILFPALVFSGPAYVYFVPPDQHIKYHKIMVSWFDQSDISNVIYSQPDTEAATNHITFKNHANESLYGNSVFVSDNLFPMLHNSVKYIAYKFQSIVDPFFSNSTTDNRAINITNWQWATGKYLFSKDKKSIIVVHPDGSCSIGNSDTINTNEVTKKAVCDDEVFYRLDTLKKQIDALTKPINQE